MAAFAGDEVNNKPDSTGEKFSHNHSQEECPEFQIISKSAIPQDNGLEKPADEYGKPDLDHRPATSHSVSDGMEWPPEKLGAHYGEKHHKHCPQSHKT